MFLYIGIFQTVSKRVAPATNQIECQSLKKKPFIEIDYKTETAIIRSFCHYSTFFLLTFSGALFSITHLQKFQYFLPCQTFIVQNVF